ncbi:ABC transporter permease subunit [Anaerosacchariphilus polymeriproducens]|uniref:ABC transporter permease subunit n=1 Tax=Anaerosacchariphilus polymeriproducens TaxID=1812858 RepID=A0A371AZT9_9FIRM|nr:ABC transporter permease subunit [Anaerosacchariphilus polymeriproducens]RDU25053.1 ABC transporter permease subunit [Anaerosacchariphilus polymeriproducens]
MTFKNNKKFYSVWILLILVLAFLNGCGKKEKQTEHEIKSVKDLAGAVIGVQLGTTGDIYASDYEKEGAVIERFTKGADAAQALKQGKVDCIIIDQQPAKAITDKNSELSILDEEFKKEEYAICISKDKSKLKNQINEVIAQLKKDKTLNNIINNYIGDSTIGKFPYQSPKDVERNNGTLTIATNAAFEPYEYMEDGEIVGIDIDIAQAIADRLGMNLIVQNMEYDSIIGAVQSGKADVGVAGMSITEDRLRSIDFTEPYTTATQVIIVCKSGNLVETSILDSIKLNFLKDNRWKYLTDGLLMTLQISFFAVIIGIVLGFIIAVIRTACDMTGKGKILNFVCKTYLTIIRGTPAMVQLLIIYYVIFSSVDVNKLFTASIAFGLNSSAYIAEIVRSGIMSVDKGQFEAGRSIGFNYIQTMWNFILPQAFKNILPALGNEFIVLLKETAISGYIGIMDLTRGGDFIRSRTYDAFLPLIAVAIIYLIIVMFLTHIVSCIERRLRIDV